MYRRHTLFSGVLTGVQIKIVLQLLGDVCHVCDSLVTNNQVAILWPRQKVANRPEVAVTIPLVLWVCRGLLSASLWPRYQGLVDCGPIPMAKFDRTLVGGGMNARSSDTFCRFAGGGLTSMQSHGAPAVLRLAGEGFASGQTSEAPDVCCGFTGGGLTSRHTSGATGRSGSPEVTASWRAAAAPCKVSAAPSRNSFRLATWYVLLRILPFLFRNLTRPLLRFQTTV